MMPPSDRCVQDLVIESRREQGYVLLTVPGNLHHEALKWIFNGAAAMAKSDGLDKVVVDCRGVGNRFSGWSGFLFGEASQVFRDYGIACALLTDPEHVDQLRVIENVAFNRAVSLHIVTTMEAALEWMRGNPLPG